MAIQPFQRLTSNTTTVFLGTNMDEAAMNAANGTGNLPDGVARNPRWPKLEKFDNDISFQVYSPLGATPNPDYIWDLPTSDGQTVAFASTSLTFGVEPDELRSFSVFLGAFADNAMEAKIELFELIGDTFVKAAPQPTGLGDVVFVAGNPNTPAVGLTETEPYNWQDIRMYSTRFFAPTTLSVDRSFKIVVSFEGTNYLPTANNPNNPNPAGLQFMVDIYQDTDFV
jgi:hypothetical protein